MPENFDGDATTDRLDPTRKVQIDLLDPIRKSNSIPTPFPFLTSISHLASQLVHLLGATAPVKYYRCHSSQTTFAKLLKSYWFKNDRDESRIVPVPSLLQSGPHKPNYGFVKFSKILSQDGWIKAQTEIVFDSWCSILPYTNHRRRVAAAFGGGARTIPLPLDY